MDTTNGNRGSRKEATLKESIEKGGFDLNLEDLNEDELLDLKLEIDSAISSIKQQIETAKVRLAVDGEYSERGWWGRIHAALRIKGAQSQQIQVALSKLSRERKQQNKIDHFRLENCFMTVARRELPLDVFERLLAEAEEEVKAECNHSERPTSETRFTK